MTTSPALLTHLAGDVLTLATLVTVTRRDGAVFGFTDHDRDISFAGNTYQAGTYTASAISSTADMAVDNLEVASYLSGAVVTQSDLLAGLWNYARVLIEQVNYADLSMGARVLRKGTLGEISIGNLSFNTELRGLTQALQQTVGELTSIRCRADLGDARCGVNLAPLTVTGTVQGIDANNCTITDSTRTEPGAAGPVAVTAISTAQYAVVTAPAHGLTAGQTIMITGVVGMVATERVNGQLTYGTTSINGRFATLRSITNANTLVLNLDTRNYSPYASGGQLAQPGAVGTFDGGKIVFTSGANAGRGMEIKAYAPGLLVLASPMPYPLAVGDAYSLTPGCGKRAIEDCYTRYNNVINFRGEPYGPGMDEMLKAGGM